MNKISALILAGVLILCSSCSSGGDTTSDSSYSEQSSATDTTSAVTDVVPSVTENVLDPDGFDEGFDENDLTNTNTTEKTPTEDTDKGEGGTSGTEENKMTYEDYINMTAQQQSDFINSFSTVSKFAEWYNAAKAVYDQNNDRIEIGDETIDIGDIFNN